MAERYTPELLDKFLKAYRDGQIDSSKITEMGYAAILYDDLRQGKVGADKLNERGQTMVARIADIYKGRDARVDRADIGDFGMGNVTVGTTRPGITTPTPTVAPVAPIKTRSYESFQTAPTVTPTVPTVTPTQPTTTPGTVNPPAVQPTPTPFDLQPQEVGAKGTAPWYTRANAALMAREYSRKKEGELPGQTPNYVNQQVTPEYDPESGLTPEQWEAQYSGTDRSTVGFRDTMAMQNAILGDYVKERDALLKKQAMLPKTIETTAVAPEYDPESGMTEAQWKAQYEGKRQLPTAAGTQIEIELDALDQKYAGRLPGMPAKVASSFVAGAADVAQMTSGIQQWFKLGDQEKAKKAAQEAKKTSEIYSIPLTEFSYDEMFNRPLDFIFNRMLGANIPRMIPFMLTLMPFSLITGNLAGGALALTKFSPLVRAIAQSVVGGTTSAMIEGTMEAGSTYTDALEAGFTEEAANRAAWMTWRKNLYTLVPDIIEYMAMFGHTLPKLGPGMTRFASSVPGKIARWGAASLPEALEELIQESAQKQALGDTRSMAEIIATDLEVQEAGLTGGFMGLLGGFGGLLHQRATTMMHNVVESLPTEKKAQVYREISNKQATGQSVEEATMEALNDLASKNDPDLVAAIEKTAKPIVDELTEVAEQQKKTQEELIDKAKQRKITSIRRGRLGTKPQETTAVGQVTPQVTPTSVAPVAPVEAVAQQVAPPAPQIAPTAAAEESSIAIARRRAGNAGVTSIERGRGTGRRIGGTTEEIATPAAATTAAPTAPTGGVLPTAPTYQKGQQLTNRDGSMDFEVLDTAEDQIQVRMVRNAQGATQSKPYWIDKRTLLGIGMRLKEGAVEPISQPTAEVETTAGAEQETVAAEAAKEEEKPAAPSFKRGDRVVWVGKDGVEHSGSIRSVDSVDGTADITTDQIAVVGGGIPIGRVDTASVKDLRPETQEDIAKRKTKAEEKPPAKEEEKPPAKAEEKPPAPSEKAAPEPATVQESGKAGIKVTENTAQDGVEISFAKKPAQEVIDRLKANGFRWSSRNKLWYAKRTDARVNLAREIAGLGKKAEGETKPSEQKVVKPESINRGQLGFGKDRIAAWMNEIYKKYNHGANNKEKAMLLWEMWKQDADILDALEADLEDMVEAGWKDSKPALEIFQSFANLDVELDPETGMLRPTYETMPASELDRFQGDWVRQKWDSFIEALGAIADMREGEVSAASTVGPSGEGALGKVSSEDVSPTGERGETGQIPVRRTGEDKGRNGGTDRSGDGLRPGVGTGEGDVAAAAERGGRAEPSPESGGLDAPGVEGPKPGATKPSNYRITDADELGKGGKVEKFNNNLAAIKLLKKIESEGRKATAEEQAVLVKYVGWGGIPDAFANRYGRASDPAWARRQLDLEETLTKEELDSARGSTLNAHFTSFDIVKALWDGAARLITKNGVPIVKQARVLEPAMGSGNFLGLVPDSIRGNVGFTGVELDSITGRIAKLLYPEANILVQGYQETNIPDDYYDVAISNVPFGDYGVTDKKYEKVDIPKIGRRNLTTPIHNYFFAKSLDAVRPGGIIMFITSRYTMDSTDAQYFRAYLASKADLVTAIRLPSSTFESNAGTSVVTDVIVLRKRMPGEEAKGPQWLEVNLMGGTPNLSYYDAGYRRGIRTNEFFIKNPKNMLGEWTTGRGMYSSDEAILTGDAAAVPDGIAKIFAELPEGILPTRQHRATEGPAPKERVKSTRKPGSYYIDENGKIQAQVGNTVFDPLSSVTEKQRPTVERKMRSLIQLRDALMDLQHLELTDASEADIKKARAKLNKLYDAFVEKNGNLHDKTNQKIFNQDPDWRRLLALEKSQRSSKGEVSFSKADVFEKRIFKPTLEIKRAESATEALLVSLRELGQINIQRMSELTGASEEQLMNELAGQVFRDPISDKIVLAEEYLSGNVRKKLIEAEYAAKDNPAYAANVEALKQIQPEWKPIEKTTIHVGADWLEPRILGQFIEQSILGYTRDYRGVQVRHDKLSGSWNIEEGDLRDHGRNFTAGVPGKTFIALVKHIVDGTTPKIYKEVEDPNDPDKTIKVVDTLATVAAMQRMDEIQKQYREWLVSDKDRVTALENQYNEAFNNFVPRQYDGKLLPELLPGQNPLVTLRSHQRNAIWRILQSASTLLAHAVGAGKTYVMAAAAMESRRLGLSNKPLIVVPNHLVGQTAEQFLRLYPQAKLLVADTTQNFTAATRKDFLAQATTGDWDSIIMPRTAFTSLSMSEAAVRKFFGEQIAMVQQALAVERAEQSRVRNTRKGVTVKELEKIEKRLSDKLKELVANIHKDPNFMSFEELGTDALYVDESHEFKNLWFWSRMIRSIAGLGNSTGSGRALDMLMKVQYIHALRGGRGGGVVFSTGTPVANSISEIYTLQRYLQPEVLAGLGLNTFDSWVRQYAVPQQFIELKPEGVGMRTRHRISKFVNTSSLFRYFRQFADVVMREDLGDIQIPKLVNPLTGEEKRVAVICEPDTAFYLFRQTLIDRAETMRTKHVDPHDDNMLMVVSDGKKASLDMGLVLKDAPENPQGKLAKATENIAGIYKATEKTRRTQLVFLDLGTPKGQTAKEEAANTQALAGEEMTVQIYQKLKDMLIAAGVKADEIAFVHDYETDTKKMELFERVNNGEIRVLLGSTNKMGTGMNVQQRLIAMHHLDTPWRPCDVEQREGRILRQGNENPEVQIYQYLMKDSLDSYMWDLIEKKARVAATALSKGALMDEVEDMADFIPAAATFKALASGNPILQRQVEVEMALVKLESQAVRHQEEQIRAVKEIAKYKEEIPKLEADVAALKGLADAINLEDVGVKTFKAELQADVKNASPSDKLETFTESTKAGERLLEFVNEHRKDVDEEFKDTRRDVFRYAGKFAGVNLFLKYYRTLDNTPVFEWFLSTSANKADFAKKLSLTMLLRSGSLVQPTSTGNISSLHATVERIANKVVPELEDKLASSKRNLEIFGKEIGKEFADSQKLKELRAEKAKIDKELALSVNEQHVISEEDVGDEESGESTETSTSTTSTNLAMPEGKAPELAGFKPERTSVSQIAGGLRRGVERGTFKSGQTVLDFGGGKFDRGVRFLAERGIKGLVYDPFARTQEHNEGVIEELTENDGADAAAMNNVLNVIDNAADRTKALQTMWDWMKPGAEAIVTVYEGDKTGVGKRATAKDGSYTWQENRRLETYVDEVKAALPAEAGVKKAGGMILITKPTTAAATTLVSPQQAAVAAAFGQMPVATTNGVVLQSARSTALIRQPMNRQAPATAKVKAVTRRQLQQFVQDEFAVPVRRRRYRERARGIYKTFSEVIRLRDEGNAEVLTHELGHHIDKIFGIKKMGNRAELIALAKYIKAKRNLLEEGAAAFFTYYVVGRSGPLGNSILKQGLPKTLAAFEALLKAEPELGRKVAAFSDLVSRYINQTAEQAVAGTIVGLNEEKPPFNAKKSMKAAWDSIRRNWDNDLSALVDVTAELTKGKPIPTEKNPYARALTARSRRYTLAESWMKHAQTEIETGKEIGPSLEAIVKPIKSDAEGFVTYAVSKHALERIDAGQEQPHERAYYQEVVNNGEAAHPEWIKVAKDLATFNDNLVREALVKTGMLSQAAADAMFSKYSFYLPLYRYFEGHSSGLMGSGSSYFGQRQPLNRAKGSERDFIHPIESMIRNLFTYLNVGLKNQTALALVDLVGGTEGGGFFGDTVARPMRPITLSAKAIEQELTDWLSQVGIDSKQHNFDWDKLFTLWRPLQAMKIDKDNVTSVWRDGKVEFWEFDPEVYKALKQIDADNTSKFFVWSALRFSTRILRMGAILNPAFWILRNPFRDQFSAVLYNKYGYSLADFWHGMAIMLKKGPEYLKYLATGAPMSTLAAGDFMRSRWIAGELLAEERTGLRKVFHQMAAIPRWLYDFSEAIENAPRVMEALRALEAGKSMTEAGLSGMEVTLPFLRGGTQAKMVNQISAFFNASIQGMTKFQREMKKNPKAIMVKSLLAITLPTMFLYAWNYDDPEYEALPTWRKAFFWNIPTPFKNRDGHRYFFPVPKPHIEGFLFGTVVEGMMDKFIKDDPYWAKTVKKAARDQLPNAIPNLIQLIYQWAANVVMFTGAPIVPEGEELLEPRYQYGTNTLAIAKALGDLFNISPRKIESTIRSGAGGLGYMGAQALSLVLDAIGGVVDAPPEPSMRVTDIPLVRDMLTQAEWSGQDIEIFYDEYQELMKAEATLKAWKTGEKPLPAKWQRTGWIKEYIKDPIAFTVRIDEFKEAQELMSKLRAARRMYEEHPTLDADIKREAIYQMNMNIINVARSVLGRELIPTPWNTPGLENR